MVVAVMTSPSNSGCRDELPENIDNPQITKVIQAVLDAKQGKKDAALTNQWGWSTLTLVGGDVFTAGYVSFQAAQAFIPKISTIAAVGVATLTCGVIGGLINIGVGIVSLKEASQALLNGEHLRGIRLMLDFVLSLGIGVAMMLAPLATAGIATVGIGVFLAANPWVFTVLFFASMCPVLFEISYMIMNILRKSDLGSQLQLDTLEKDIKNEKNWNAAEFLNSPDHPNPLSVHALQNCNTQEERIELVNQKMNELQEVLGVTAAVEIFRLWQLLLQHEAVNKDVVVAQIATVREQIQEWNRSLYVRMIQQILLILSVCFSTAALSPTVNAKLFDGIQNGCMMGANTIGLYMDALWPFKRNTPIVVPKVETEEVQRALSEAAPQLQICSGRPRLPKEFYRPSYSFTGRLL